MLVTEGTGDSILRKLGRRRCGFTEQYQKLSALLNKSVIK